jgi:hypothetical protein
MGDKDYELAASNTRVIPFTRFRQLLKLIKQPTQDTFGNAALCAGSHHKTQD